MKKLVVLLLLVSFTGFEAQKKKSGPKTKTTVSKTKKDKKKKKGQAEAIPEAAAPTTNNTSTTAVDEFAELPALERKPINSLSILNAKSPDDYKYFRDRNEIKKGDSIVSSKVKPLSYGYIEDKDVLRSIMVWEVMDLNEKINQPFFHNADNFASKNKSLYQILLDAIYAGKIREVYDDDMFTTRLDRKTLKQRTTYVKVSDALRDLEAEGKVLTADEKKQYIDTFETKTENVKTFKIKGIWYIDKRNSQMKYRLLGISAMGKDPASFAIATDPNAAAMGLNKDELIDLFWVYYPDAREVLANNLVFNSKNLASDVSYDDVLNARRFSSIIYKSENGMGTGKIEDYIPKDAEEQLEESDRIKNSILAMEADMWNY
jgi:gliding motility associated protien GldN